MKKRLLIMLCAVLLLPILLVSVSAAVIDDGEPASTNAFEFL